ncbi:MAG: hypothetical protein U0183_30765 [Polyangiaceae bacterium]
MSAKGTLVRLLGGAFLRRAQVVGVEEVGGFSRVVLRGEVERAEPGTKLQLLLPGDDMRTYTPIATAEGIVLLGWRHAPGPGGRWAASVKEGDELLFVGPQRSLVLPEGRAIVVGDETSVAVAASFEAARAGRVTAVLEASEVTDVRAAAARVGLGSASVLARGDTAGLVDAIVRAREEAPSAAIALTGGSELILRLRAALKERGLADVRTKTYWVPGRQGLD